MTGAIRRLRRFTGVPASLERRRAHNRIHVQRWRARQRARTLTAAIIWNETVLDAFGTSSRAFANREISRLLESLRATGQRHAPQDDVNAALAAVDGTRPENEMAAMLAGQMAVTHALAMDMLSWTKRAEFIDEMHAYGALATKLLRTYTMQTEALAKLKRGGGRPGLISSGYFDLGLSAMSSCLRLLRIRRSIACWMRPMPPKIWKRSTYVVAKETFRKRC